jgi:hypothetical protein
MADTVRTNVIFSGGRRHAIHLEAISDGTGESAVTKVDLSGLKMFDGSIPKSVALTELSYNVEGYTDVILYWQRDPVNIEMAVLKGHGAISFAFYGGLQDPSRDGTGTGNILLTSNGAVSGATYQIDLELKLKN